MYTESTNVFENCFVIHHFSYILLSASSGPAAMLGAWVPHLDGPLHQHWEWYQIKRVYIYDAQSVIARKVETQDLNQSRCFFFLHAKQLRYSASPLFSIVSIHSKLGDIFQKSLLSIG